MTGLRPLPWQAPHWHAVSTALQQLRLAHALLLVGPRGVGKRHFTALLAQALLCLKPDDGLPCGGCRSCILVQATTHPDLFRLEKEEGSKVVKVDDLREFNRKVFLTPQMGRGVVGIVDPVDGLNRNSANALLKTLEEPPLGAHILLVGERWMGLPATLRSRCLTLRFALPAGEAVTSWLHEQPAEGGAAWPALRARYEPDTAGRQSRAAALAAMCQGREDPVALAERWHKTEQDLPELLDWMHGCISDLLKLKAQAPVASLGNPQALKPLQAMAVRLSGRSLNGLAQLGLETRRLLEQSQAKPQMLLENLLASWYQGARSGPGPARGELSA
jgi:DNA polymerase-3 subunit delta'